jgi:hypothetical protein
VLKDVITEKNKEVNQKYQTAYTVDLWCHLFACSNSMRALRLDNDDRRWFIPRVTEEKNTTELWTKLHHWLAFEDGVGKIKTWMNKYLDGARNVQGSDLNHGLPVLTGQAAPATDTKAEVIREGYSGGMELIASELMNIRRFVERQEREAQGLALDDDDVASGAKKLGLPVLDDEGQTIVARGTEGGIERRFLTREDFTTDKELRDFVRLKLYDGRPNDRLEKPATLKGVARTMGFHIGEKSISVRNWGEENRDGFVISLSEAVALKTPGQLNKEGRKPFKISEVIVF